MRALFIKRILGCAGGLCLLALGGIMFGCDKEIKEAARPIPGQHPLVSPALPPANA